MAVSSHTFDTANGPVRIKLEVEPLDVEKDPAKETAEMDDFISVKIEPDYDEDDDKQRPHCSESTTYKVKVEDMSLSLTGLDQAMPELIVQTEYSDHSETESLQDNPVAENSDSSQDSDVTLAHLKKVVKDNSPNKSNSFTNVLKNNTISEKRKTQKNKQKQIMKKNENTERDKGVFPCDLCGKKFKYPSALVQHKYIHSGEKLFSCEICDKKFNTKSSLVRHKLIHTGQKPFRCDLCDRPFRVIGDLQKHRMTHTDEKPFSCDICHKKFRRSNHLIEHKYIHTGDKPFHCDVCDKNFRYSSGLLNHKLIHEGFRGYPCDICNEYFKRKSYLETHKLTHIGVKPSCDVCQKQFVNMTNLKRHIVIHSGKKPFSCLFCTKTFKKSTQLSLHKQKCHSDHYPIEVSIVNTT